MAKGVRVVIRATTEQKVRGFDWMRREPGMRIVPKIITSRKLLLHTCLDRAYVNLEPMRICETPVYAQFISFRTHNRACKLPNVLILRRGRPSRLKISVRNARALFGRERSLPDGHRAGIDPDGWLTMGFSHHLIDRRGVSCRSESKDSRGSNSCGML